MPGGIHVVGTPVPSKIDAGHLIFVSLVERSMLACRFTEVSALLACAI